MGRLDRYLLFAWTLLILIASASCTKEDMTDKGTGNPRIYVMFSPGGLGDSGYNDLILTGFQRVRLDYPETELIFYMPDSPQEAEALTEKWLAEGTPSGRQLFVLASSDYEQMLRNLLQKHYPDADSIPDKDILLFESPNKYSLPIRTMRISIFGASYLAGLSAAEGYDDRPALVIGANPNDEPVLSAIYGFIRGWESRSASEIDTVHMSTDWNGFIQAEQAYRKMHEWSKEYGFVFPVAGGTNNGVYKYLRENPGTMKTTGMDVDQSYLSSDIIGSVLKHIDRLIYDKISEWIETADMQLKDHYGLGDGYSQWFWNGDIGSDILREAIRLENEYEDK